MKKSIGYLDKVKVISGFYKGHSGIIMRMDKGEDIDKNEVTYYEVEIKCEVLQSRKFAVHFLLEAELERLK